MQPEQEEKSKNRQRDIDVFSSFMSEEMKNEMERLLKQQKNLKKEISQLREERNFFFEELQKQTVTPKREEAKMKITSDFIFSNNQKPKLVDTSTQTNETRTKYNFSKEKLLRCLSKHHNSMFPKISNFIQESKSGDAMVSYFVNSTGVKIDMLEREISFLQDEIMKLQSKRRREAVNSIQSLVAASSDELRLKCEMIDAKYSKALSSYT